MKSPPRVTREELRLSVGGALLLVLILALNGLAIANALAARRQAEREEQDRRAAQLALHTRSLESDLASLRSNLVFLGHSAALADFARSATAPDPARRRATRLHAEGSVLLFLQANPAIGRLFLVDPQGAPRLAAGRRGGAPILLPDRVFERGPAREPLVRSYWPIGGDPALGLLVADLDAEELSAAADPEGRYRRLAAGATASADAAVEDAAWDPPVHWQVAVRAGGRSAVSDIDRLAGRYGTMIALNAALVLLAATLAVLVVREVRRATLLEAETRQAARLRELERGLHHAERLASVGRTAAAIAHEINNPLEGMSNHLALLEDDLAHGRVEASREQAARVREGVDRVAGVTRSVLRLADPGRGAKTPVSVADVVARSVEFVRERADRNGVDIRLDVRDRSPLVSGNATTLGQLVLNLLLNACEAQPDGGEVEASLAADGDVVRVTVADRGPGIPPGTLDRLFEPFHSTKGSTGLGLAVCRGIADDHGGSLRAANREGGGAAFTLELPRHRGASEVA